MQLRPSTFPGGDDILRNVKTKIIAYSFTGTMSEGWQHAEYVEINSFLATDHEHLLTQVQNTGIKLSFATDEGGSVDQAVADYQIDLIYKADSSIIRRDGHWSDGLTLATFDETQLRSLPEHERDASVPLAKLVAQQTVAIQEGADFLRTSSVKTANRVAYMMAQLESAHRLSN